MAASLVGLEHLASSFVSDEGNSIATCCQKLAALDKEKLFSDEAFTSTGVEVVLILLPQFPKFGRKQE
jgi:hypothetical protein